jgi:DNA-binding GntR family transcriptional regulator
MTFQHFVKSWAHTNLAPGPMPPRAQIAARLRNDIQAGAFQPGHTRTESVRSVAAPDWLATELAVSPNTLLVTFDRLLCADDCPIATSATWLAPFVSEHSPALTVAELDSGSFYHWLEERAGIRLAEGREVVAAIPADATTAKLLNLVAGTPVLENPPRLPRHREPPRGVRFAALPGRPLSTSRDVGAGVTGQALLSVRSIPTVSPP